METQEFISDSLNEQQLQMLRLFKRPMPEASFAQIRDLPVKLLADQIKEKMEDCEEKNDITAEYYENSVNQHFRSAPKKVDENLS